MGERFILNVAFKSLVDRIARVLISGRGCVWGTGGKRGDKTYEQVVGSKDGTSVQCWKEG